MSRAVAVLLVAVALFLSSGRGWAQPAAPLGPSISLQASRAEPGHRVAVALSGWRSRNVTLAVCGNLARRGSADCNVASSQSVRLFEVAAPTRAELVVFSPPVSCPCVVRASDAAQNEVAVAPIELAGVPIGPVVGPVFGPLIDVSLAVVRLIGALSTPSDRRSPVRRATWLPSPYETSPARGFRASPLPEPRGEVAPTRTLCSPSRRPASWRRGRPGSGRFG